MLPLNLDTATRSLEICLGFKKFFLWIYPPKQQGAVNIALQVLNVRVTQYGNGNYQQWMLYVCEAWFL